MKLGIMQPYFVPYIGYWQLLNAVDKYVIYDDVNFINRGWINRNRILVNGSPKYFNVPLQGKSQNKLINEVTVNNDPILVAKNLRAIDGAYKKAPFFNDVYPIVEKILNCSKSNIAEYNAYSFNVLCEYLDISTTMILSSSIDKNTSLKGQEKIIDICRQLNATEYYNAIGGRELYSQSAFEANNIKLHFLNTKSIEYKQFNNTFVPNLSIIDVMMFNDKNTITRMLNMYTLE